MSRFMPLACIFFGLVLLSPTTVSAPAAPDADKESAFRWLDANADAMRRVSLNIWNAAEVAMHEYKSSRELMADLESNGFRVEKGVAGMPTAFVANYGSGKPLIAIYGEYDALAGLSQKAETSFAPLTEGSRSAAPGRRMSLESISGWLPRQSPRCGQLITEMLTPWPGSSGLRDATLRIGWPLRAATAGRRAICVWNSTWRRDFGPLQPSRSDAARSCFRHASLMRFKTCRTMHGRTERG
jgi:hypothetical protein